MLMLILIYDTIQFINIINKIDVTYKIFVISRVICLKYLLNALNIISYDELIFNIIIDNCLKETLDSFKRTHNMVNIEINVNKLECTFNFTKIKQHPITGYFMYDDIYIYWKIENIEKDTYINIAPCEPI